MVDFNGIKTILFLPKDAPKSLAAGAEPQTPLDELTRVLHTVGVDEDERNDEFAYNLNFLTTPLW